jgi:hypothetical protein
VSTGAVDNGMLPATGGGLFLGAMYAPPSTATVTFGN